MPFFETADDNRLHYRIDDFTDPWRESKWVLFLHGNAESGDAWYGWVPHLARRYKTLRPDMRGFGRSTPMPSDFEWTIEQLVEDVTSLLDSLGIDKVHVVGAKIGSMLAMKLAATTPERILSLTVVGPPASIRDLAAGGPPVEIVIQEGVGAWARVNMSSRLGSAMPREAGEWWSTFMGRTDAATQIGFMRHLPIFDVHEVLDKIESPTLVLISASSSIGSEQATRAWQARIANSRIVVVPGDSYHVAVSDADHCATLTGRFIATCE
jgi:pimeloyl-ACP methyl ester carboxylesterase